MAAEAGQLAGAVTFKIVFARPAADRDTTYTTALHA
jgi:hypothetical protein